MTDKAEHNAYMSEYMTRRYHRRRAAAIEKLGGKCNECGSTDGLELDHKDPKNKSFEFAKALSGWAEARVQKELKKAQLLCTKCHTKKSIKDSGKLPATHGTYAMYRHHKCRCNECREANRKHNSKYVRVQNSKG